MIQNQTQLWHINEKICAQSVKKKSARQLFCVTAKELFFEMTRYTKLTIKQTALTHHYWWIKNKNRCKGSQTGYRTIFENSRILHIYRGGQSANKPDTCVIFFSTTSEQRWATTFHYVIVEWRSNFWFTIFTAQNEPEVSD